MKTERYSVKIPLDLKKEVMEFFATDERGFTIPKMQTELIQDGLSQQKEKRENK